ncbi:hypothetical protein TSAR_003240 [Trichomalopsis sarcophagae]|uniref:YqaJ viral recombinase domain-containing protein n=1 Tax=Trichomalopsis sarcophagae TaxID=543379 RepID=A0A232EG20_9HYME|nr:hypothetical protein TSAR_003240 [Trichomalopsis sarcophagae]
MSALAKHELGRHDPIVLKEKSKVSQAEKEVIKIILEAQDSDTMQYIQKFEVLVLQDCYLNTIDHLSHNLQTISENTKDHYDHWIRERQYRITGSICYRLFTYTKLRRSVVAWKKKFQSTFAPKNYKTAAMEHGNLSESEARNAFRKVVNSEVVEVGLIVSRLNPWLAYSPDGILIKQNKPIALLEIKCPMAGKSAGIQKTVNSQMKKCLVQVGENIILKEKHAYYGQIQLGMAVLNLLLTYFVIYSPFDKNLFILRVGRNNLFITTMLNAFKKVYFAYRLHDICLNKQDCDNTASKQLEVLYGCSSN